MRRGAICSTRAATARSPRQWASAAPSGSGPCQTEPIEISGRCTCSQGQLDFASGAVGVDSAVADSLEAGAFAPGVLAALGSGAVLPGAVSCAKAKAVESTSAV